MTATNAEATYTSARHAAAYYDVTTQTLRRWVKAGKLKAFKTPSGQYRYEISGRPAVVDKPKPAAVAKPKVVRPTPLETAIAKTPTPKLTPADLSRTIDALAAG